MKTFHSPETSTNDPSKPPTRDHFELLSEWCKEQKTKKRPKYKIVAILNAGNGWGEKRIFRYLEEMYSEDDLILLEGSPVKRIDPKDSLDRVITRSETRKNTEVDRDHLKNVLIDMFLEFSSIDLLMQNKSKVLGLIADPEDEETAVIEGMTTDGFQGSIGLLAVEAFGVLNANARIYGIEDAELYVKHLGLAVSEMQGLTPEEMKTKYKESSELYKIARLRSEVMFNNSIKLMDDEKAEKSHICLTVLQSSWFEEQCREREIQYEKRAVTALPKLEE